MEETKKENKTKLISNEGKEILLLSDRNFMK